MKTIVDSADFYFGVQANSPSPDDYEYVDKKSNVLFIVPAMYQQEDVDKDLIKIQFLNSEKKEVLISYGYVDIYKKMPITSRIFTTRQSINNSFFTKEDIADIFGCNIDEIEKVTYGDTEYYKGVYNEVEEQLGIELEVEIINLIHVENGRMHMFYFSGKENSPYYSDFERMLSSVQYPKINGFSQFLQNLSVSVVFGFILTVTIYSLPIIIYRYAIHGNPVQPKKAKKIVIIYAILAFFVMSFILILMGGRSSGSAIVLWSYINYRILISGYKKEDTNNYEDQSMKPKTREVFFYHTCTKCGDRYKVKYNMPEYKKVIPDLETVCHKCKTKQFIKSNDIKDWYVVEGNSNTESK